MSHFQEPGASEEQGTILFADIVGSTRMYEALGDSEALRIVQRTIGILSAIVSADGGTVVKTLGDEIMAVFPTPLSAWNAAAAILDLADQGCPGIERPLHFRVGFHHGPLLHTPDGDHFGDTVNTASRLVELCRPNQALTSRDCVERYGESVRGQFRSLGSFTLKGKQAEFEVFELSRRGSDTLTVLAGFATVSREASLQVLFGDRRLVLNKEQPSIRMGRAADNDLVYDVDLVSRHHARIEFRRDKFALIDESTNGTWVQFNNEVPLRLRREEMLLRQRGIIVLGRAPKDCSGDWLIRFNLL